MIELREEDMMVHLAVDDAHTAQAAGVRFAHTLAGDCSADFTLALAEQTDLIERAIADAGFSEQQARLAAGHFEVAARDAWQRIASSGGSGAWGTA